MQIILREIRSFYRDIPGLFFACLFPLTLVFLLGTMLENIEVSEYDIGQLEVGYLLDTEEVYASGSEGFFEEAAKEGDIVFEKFTSKDAAMEKVAEGNLSALVCFEGDGVEIYGGENVTQNRAVKAMIDGYLTTAGTFSSIITENPILAMDLETTDESLVVKKESVASRSMIDYYAVSMIVMIMFMGGITTTCGSIHDDRKNGTLRRVFGSPENKTLAFLEMILGNIPYAVIQIGIIMLGSVLMFRAKYCADLKGNLVLFLMLFVVSMALIAFSALLGLVFVKGNPQMLAMAISWVMLFLSGSFAKSVHIEGLSEYLPTYIVQNAAFDLTIFGRYEQVTTVTIVSAVLFAIFLYLGTVVFNKRGDKV